MIAFIEKILNKTRKWVLPLALLKMFSIVIAGLSIPFSSPIFWPLRFLLIALATIGLSLGTLSIYLDILGAIYYLVKRRKEDRIFLWALLIHTHYFFYGLTQKPIWLWTRDNWSVFLNYTFGGPWLFGEIIPGFFTELKKTLLDPTYVVNPFIT